jgi:hypothetical protein
MTYKGGRGSSFEVDGAIVPFLAGFFLFWLWVATDFPLQDKFLMTSLVVALEMVLALNLPPLVFRDRDDEDKS